MPVIAVTGGIASGKSEFCAILARRFLVEIFDSDACARSLLNTDPGVRQSVLRDVHPEAYRPDGSPDRAAIRALVFSNPDVKARLEAILHPLVRERRLAWVAERRGVGRFLVVDIPLFFESGASGFEFVLTVACSKEVQISRVMSRGLERYSVEQILASQWDTLRKMDNSDFVVWNDGAFRVLEDQVDELAQRLQIPLRQTEK